MNLQALSLQSVINFMKEEIKNGIAVAGTVLVDSINEITAYPQCGRLTQITNIEKSVGGCVPNVAVDIKKICPWIDVQAIGKIGDDQDGKFILDTLLCENINISGIVTSENKLTSKTEVMSVVNGQRTFFTYTGASAGFGYSDIDFQSLNVKLFHLGYFLLLQKVDSGDGIRILKKLKEMGIETSIDLVSENSDRYSIVLPCLKYVDYLIINETEAGNLTGINPTDDNIENIAKKLKSLGVCKKVIIHKPDFSVCLSDEGYVEVNSYLLPNDYIKGTTGAGDAFCAGALIGIYKGLSDKQILEFASACAVLSLGKPDATSGLVCEYEIIEYCKKFKRIEREN